MIVHYNYILHMHTSAWLAVRKVLLFSEDTPKTKTGSHFVSLRFYSGGKYVHAIYNRTSQSESINDYSGVSGARKPGCVVFT